MIYVDDIWSGENGWIEARQVSRTIAMTLNYLGLQDAARKRRDPSQQLGPWEGSVVGIAEGVIYVTVKQECWDKAKTMVKWMCKVVEMWFLKSLRVIGDFWFVFLNLPSLCSLFELNSFDT